MPPRSISSYFTKPVVQAAAASTSAAAPALNGAATSPSREKNITSTTTTESPSTKNTVTETTLVQDDPKSEHTPTIVTARSDETSVAGPSSLPAASGSGPSLGTKRSKLSDAMRKAIADGMAEGEADNERATKRMKVEVAGEEKPKVAPIFAKPTTTSPAKPLLLPSASTRADLLAALSTHPQKLALLQLELDTLGEDWLLALQDELTKPYFLTLKGFVTKEQESKKVFPPAADIYSWSRLCPLKDVRVVIIGQDPYHDDGQAHGLAFSVRKGMRIPPSLRNIYKQMHDDVPAFQIPKHGDLTEWAKHGVLLLNTSLTVRAHEAASHANKGWETFTAAVLKVVTSRLNPATNTSANAGGHIPGANGVVFMAWGSHAQKMCAGVDQKKHLVLKSAHPSPLAASRGFFGNGHFKKANEWLHERYGPEGGIDWASLGAQE